MHIHQPLKDFLDIFVIFSRNTLSLNTRDKALRIIILSLPTDRVETGRIGHFLVQELFFQQCCIECRWLQLLLLLFIFLFFALERFYFDIIIYNCLLQPAQDWTCFVHFSQCTEYRFYFRLLDIHNALLLLELHRFRNVFPLIACCLFLQCFRYFLKIDFTSGFC